MNVAVDEWEDGAATQGIGMQVLVGHTRGLLFVETLRRLDWGRMMVFENPDPYEGERWGFDNGAFMYWRRGLPFDDKGYAYRLERAEKVGTPYLAVPPDIVAGGLRSLEFSMKWFEKMPDRWPCYLAVQDGMTRRDVEGVIRAGWAGLFLGGSNDFKKTAPMWADLAHEFGLKFHYGRAGTLKKLEIARQAHSDSIDSTFPTWTKDRMETFVRRYQEGDPQRMLPVGIGE